MFSQFGLYLVLTDPAVGYEECALAAANEGAYIIQLNMGDAPRSEVLRIAGRVKEALGDTDSLLIIKDDIETARAVDADGLHLGPGGMSLSEAREHWNNPEKVFGIHLQGNVYDIREESPEPDYLFAGPVFAHPAGEKYPALLTMPDMEGILDLSRVPVVAFGGITSANLRELLDTGTVNYAVDAAVCQSHEPGKMVKKFREIEEEYLSW